MTFIYERHPWCPVIIMWRKMKTTASRGTWIHLVYAAADVDRLWKDKNAASCTMVTFYVKVTTNMSRVKKTLSKNWLALRVLDIAVFDATLSLVHVNSSFELLLLMVNVYSLAIGCSFILIVSRVIIVVYSWPKDLSTRYMEPIFCVKLMPSLSTVQREWVTVQTTVEIVDSVRRMPHHLLQGLHSVKLRLTVCQNRRQSSHQKNEAQKLEAVEVDEVRSYCPVCW